jgi:hypothetical protein
VLRAIVRRKTSPCRCPWADRPRLTALPRPLLALTSPRMPSRIVTYAHRPKRAPRKKAQAAAITGPAIVIAASKRDRERRRETVDDGQEASPEIKASFARMMRPHDV